MDRTERFYKIDQMLLSGRSVAFARLMESLGVSRAQLRRDLQYMRERLNAPIEYDREANGYRYGEPAFGADVEVLGPKELRAKVRDALKAAAKLY